jgi:hypothetical protein
MASNYSEFAYTLITHVEFWPSNFFPRTGHSLHSLQLFRGQTKNMWDIANDLKKISNSRWAILKCKNVNIYGIGEGEGNMLYFFFPRSLNSFSFRGAFNFY